MWWRMPLATILLASWMACNHCTVHAQQRRDSKGVDETSSNDGDSSSIPVVLVTSFADDELLSVCRGNLLASKEEGKRFGPQHFSSFLVRQSRGLIRATFLKLHAIFVLIFYTAACLSCFSETNDTECCLGDRAYIPFQDEVEPDTFYLILDFLCTNVDVLIDDLTTKAPALPPVSPTASPTTAPSVQPTGTPIDSPPSALPSNAPSGSTPRSALLSFTPSLRPFDQATLPPTESPSNVPSSKPVTIPVEVDLLCISFAYELINTAGFSADAVFLELNNTIKQGLLTATRNVTISVLNGTQPTRRDLMMDDEQYLEGARRSLDLALISHHDGVETSGLGIDSEIVARFSRDFRQRSFRRYHTEQTLRRRLAFYSDDFPVRIVKIVESMFCPDNVDCMYVFTDVCVVLAASDEAIAVRSALIRRFEDTINSGAFNDAIPPGLVP